MKHNFNLLKRILSTAIISDVFDELGITGMLSDKFKSNFEHAKLCGRAKTIHVVKREDNEPINSIYNGLKIYSTVKEDDVIVIKNELGHLAYWGELNTMLALREKASGTIVDGVTRDNAQTRALDYPVFAKGRYSKDIKNHGAIHDLNCPVTIDDISIIPGYLIFGDIDGIAVIPRDREDEVIKRALEIAFNEKSLIGDIVKGLEPHSLVEKYGFF